MADKSSSGDEIPERDMTYRLICLLIYHWTTNTTKHPFRNILLSNAYLLHITDVGLRKTPCISTFRVSSLNYYLVCSLLIHKICALCGIFSAISVLLTTKNSDDLEIRVTDGSRRLKVTPVNSSCQFLLVINCTRRRILYRLWILSIGPPSLYFATPLAFNAPTEGFPWDDLRKILQEVRRWLRYSSEEISPKTSTPWVGRTNVTDRRQTDGFAIGKTRT